jgi:hypothetical protein
MLAGGRGRGWTCGSAPIVSIHGVERWSYQGVSAAHIPRQPLRRRQVVADS